jgi:hypothetical protein
MRTPWRRWVVNIKMDLRDRWCDGVDWIALAQNRTSGGLLWTRWWIFGFHKMLGNSWVAAELAAPQEGLSSMIKKVSQNITKICKITPGSVCSGLKSDVSACYNLKQCVI